MRRNFMGLIMAALFMGQWTYGLAPQELSDLTGREDGLIVVAGVKNAQDVLPLGEAGYLVYGLCPDDASFLSVSQAAMAKGLLNQRVYLQKSSARVPGLAERLADVMVVESLDKARMQDDSLAKWMKALSPWRGILLVETGDVPDDEIKSWLGDKTVMKDVGGKRFAMLKRPPEEGADQWRHRHHAPDNRRVSDDQLFNPNVMTQWYSLPLEEGFWGTTVVAAGGRIYTLVASRNPGDQVDLVARSLHNGCELWRRHYGWKEKRDGMNAGIYGGRSIMVAGNDVLWIADGADIISLDGETGKERQRISGPVEGGQVKWLALVGDNLIALAGPADDYKKLTFQAFVKNPEGTHLAVYTTGGESVWQESCAGPVDEREIAIHDGRIYYHCNGVATVARNLSDGSEIWRNTTDYDQIDALKGNDINRLLNSDRALMADEYAVIIGASWKKNLVALDPKDGRVMWQLPIGKTSRSLAAVLRDGKWYGWSILDARTGEKVSERGKAPQSICSVTGSVGDWMMTAFADLYTLDDQKQVRFADMRAPCDMGNLVADGVLLGSAIQCTCSVDIRGYRAAGPSDAPQHSAGPAEERLVVFDSNPPADLGISEKDWPTHRHDVNRTGYSSVSIGDKPVEKWHKTQTEMSDSPEGFLNRILPSGAVSANGLCFYVDNQGVLRCLSVESGEEKWNAVLGARSLAAPALEGDRVFVGDTAGYVHAFSAADGRALWRFLAAPVERRILWYGQLFNTWPCTGGVVAQDGVVYAVAGFQETNGMHAYALDAATGKVRWENHEAGTGGEWGPEGAFGLYGNMTIGDGRLWLASSTFYPGSYSLQDGTPQAAPCGKDHHFYGLTMRRGVDILSLDDNYIITGGIRLANMQEPKEQILKADGYNALSTTPPDVPKRWKDKSFYGVDMLNSSYVTPAYDEKIFVGGRGKEGKIQVWPIDSLKAELKAEFDKGMDEGDRNRHQIRSLNSGGKRGVSEPANPIWRPVELVAQEQVLTADCIVTVHAELDSPPGRWSALPERTGWYLSALERTDGAERWRVDLPAKPLKGGLSVDRNGNILIVFDDASVACYGK